MPAAETAPSAASVEFESDGVILICGACLTATAVVAATGITGTRAFAVKTEGTIWEDITGGTAAPTEAAMLAAPTATVRPLR